MLVSKVGFDPKLSYTKLLTHVCKADDLVRLVCVLCARQVALQLHCTIRSDASRMQLAQSSGERGARQRLRDVGSLSQVKFAQNLLFGQFDEELLL